MQGSFIFPLTALEGSVWSLNREVNAQRWNLNIFYYNECNRKSNGRLWLGKYGIYRLSNAVKGFCFCCLQDWSFSFPYWWTPSLHNSSRRKISKPSEISWKRTQVRITPRKAQTPLHDAHIHVYLNTSASPACSFCRNPTVWCCRCLLLYPSTVRRLIASMPRISDLSGCPLTWTAFLSIFNSRGRWLLFIKMDSSTGNIFLNWWYALQPFRYNIV